MLLSGGRGVVVGVGVGVKGWGWGMGWAMTQRGTQRPVEAPYTPVEGAERHETPFETGALAPTLITIS